MKAASAIRDIFVSCLNRSQEPQKRQASLRVVNVMFQIYFQV